MTEYLIIRNAYKAPIKRVFDYLDVESLRNPNEKQKVMLAEICDGVDFLQQEKVSDAKKQLKEGDYLYEVSFNKKEKELVCIYPPKKIKSQSPIKK